MKLSRLTMLEILKHFLGQNKSAISWNFVLNLCYFFNLKLFGVALLDTLDKDSKKKFTLDLKKHGFSSIELLRTGC